MCHARENMRYVVYEGIFLNNDEVRAMFHSLRGEPLYSLVPADFHVTSTFLPVQDMRALYGQQVSVEVTAYKDAVVTNDDGQPTRNEGVAVRLRAADPLLQAHLDAKPVNWHITGSSQEAHKYTGQINFATDSAPVHTTLTGTFGAFLNGGSVVFDAMRVDTPIEEEVVNL